jgi:diacylglycerol kinase (ATP)
MIPPKKTGFRHLYAAVGYAFDGFMVLAKEVAFWHELIFLIVTFIIFAVLDVTGIFYLASFMVWCILIASEAINTALEHIVDRLSPEISDFAKKTKDLGSLAVFCMIIVNLTFTMSIIFIFY